jgi:hypothetical protein
MHAGGGFAGGGSFHGGGYGGGYHGGSSGGYSGRGSYAGPRGGSGATRSSVAGHPWSWEGHSSRDTSPGWHQFASSNTGNMARSGAATSASRSMSSPASRQSRAAAMDHASIADGHWHSFAGPSSEVARATVPASVSRAGLVSTGVAWHGNNFGVWHGGVGWRWGWGWPGWNWGWGWGCCGWGWGWGVGFGWGWGFGWGAWAPFWAWPPYGYSPYWYSPWLDAGAPPSYVLDPYQG